MGCVRRVGDYLGHRHLWAVWGIGSMIFVALKRLLHLTATAQPSLSDSSSAPDEEKPKPSATIWSLHHIWGRGRKQNGGGDRNSRHALRQIIYKGRNSALHRSLRFAASLAAPWYRAFKVEEPRWSQHLLFSDPSRSLWRALLKPSEQLTERQLLSQMQSNQPRRWGVAKEWQI